MPLTTDGHGAYLRAVEETFGIDVDYAQLVKLYGQWVTVIQDVIFVACVLLFRKGIVGEIAAKLKTALLSRRISPSSQGA